MIDPAITAAVLTYGFRARRPGEHEAAYAAAVIAHVHSRDYAAAHELRLNKPQADWTPADVDGFVAHLTGLPGARDTFTPGDFQMLPGLTIGQFPVTEAAVMEIAGKGLEAMMEMRRADPTRELAIIGSVLLMNGDLLTLPLPRGDRIAWLKHLARTEPVFGFVLAADVFIHAISVDKVATKRDALLVHLGTRDLRVMKRRPYQVVNGRVEFEHPPPPDVDVRDPTVTVNDPYASIFVSVPPSRTPQ